MKNYLKMTLIAAMAIPMFFSLSSCDDDDDQEDEIYKGSFELVYNVYDDFLSVANIEVSYYDENGELRSESITKAEWKKKIIYKKLPANTGFKITCTMKNQLPEDQTVFNIGHQYDGSLKLVKENPDEIVTYQSLYYNLSSDGVGVENLESAIKNHEVNAFYQITDKEIIKISK